MSHQSPPNAADPLGFGPFGTKIREFLRLESSGGLILMAFAVLAMIVKNSPLAGAYTDFLNLHGIVGLGALEVSKPLFLWVNDAWMAVFFFLVGMEIKREFLHGYLSDRSQVILPASAAVGGMLIPALIYLLFTGDDPIAAKGWAIPTATDIAFALGVLALLGTRAPIALKVMLMTLAALDDLGAIFIIALFYTANISPAALATGMVFAVALIALNRLKVRRLAAYVLVGTALWVCVLKSGVHATLAGVLTAFAVPGRLQATDTSSLLETTIQRLHPWVAFGILPMFAFVNAGIALDEVNASSLTDPIPVGIFLGLAAGKPIGVLVFSAVVVLAGWTQLPPGVSWRQMAGIAFLCGIGFTMSLFVASLAFQEAGVGFARVDRLATILASIVSGAIGYLILRFGGQPIR